MEYLADTTDRRPGPSGSGTRKRYGEGVTHEGPDESMYEELNRLRGIVNEMESAGSSGGRETNNNSSSYALNLNNSAMSMMFGFILMVIIVVTVYAFANLYWALSKRFSDAAIEMEMQME